jgi:hypothetical protein
MANLRARTVADLGDVSKAVADMEFRFDSISHDARVRRIEIPLRLRRIRREGLLRLRGVRSFSVEGRIQQESDSVRALQWDPSSRRLTVECTPSRLVIEMDDLDVEAEDGLAVAREVNLSHLPVEAQRAIAAKEANIETRHDRYETVRRSAERNVGLLGAVLSASAGLLFGNPWWALLLNALTGGAAGFLIVRGRIDTPAIGAILLALPAMLLSTSGSMFERMTAGAGMLAAMYFGLWLILLVLGGLLSTYLSKPQQDEDDIALPTTWQATARSKGFVGDPDSITTTSVAAYDGGASISGTSLRKAILGTAGASFGLCVLLGAHPLAVFPACAGAIGGGIWCCVRRGWGAWPTAFAFVVPLWLALSVSGGVPTDPIGTTFLLGVHGIAGFAMPSWPAYERGRRRT